jgi:hypothetical protein
MLAGAHSSPAAATMIAARAGRPQRWSSVQFTGPSSSFVRLDVCAFRSRKVLALPAFDACRGERVQSSVVLQFPAMSRHSFGAHLLRPAVIPALLQLCCPSGLPRLRNNLQALAKTSSRRFLSAPGRNAAGPPLGATPTP